MAVRFFQWEFIFVRHYVRMWFTSLYDCWFGSVVAERFWVWIQVFWTLSFILEATRGRPFSDFPDFF